MLSFKSLGLDLRIYPLSISPPGSAHSAGPAQNLRRTSGGRLFFRFFALAKRTSKMSSKNHRKKCENRGFWPPKTLPKSAAPALGCPGVPNQCAFIYMLLNTCFNTLRGRPANPTESHRTKIRSPCWAMLALFFALGRFLGAFGTSCCVCARSWTVFAPLKPLRARSGAHRARFWSGFGRFWKSKASIFRGFCVQAKQHCANALTLTKHWQEQQKSRFSIYRELRAQARKQ